MVRRGGGGLGDFPALSPSGRVTCPGSGPRDSEILAIGESPSDDEIADQQPFVGRAGRMLSLCATPAGFDRAGCRLVNAVPCQPMGNKFANHTEEDLAWGKAWLQDEIDRMPRLKLIVCLGGNPAEWVLGIRDLKITKWRGSLWPAKEWLTGDRYNEYWTMVAREPEVRVPDSVAVLPTFHPAAVMRQMPWQIWLIDDLKKAARYVRGDYEMPYRREWYVNDIRELERVIDEVILSHEHMVAVDTEMVPLVTCLVTEEEVHSFEFCDRAREPLRRLMRSDKVLKVAHNMAHDWRQFEKIYRVKVEPPWLDTIAPAHILEPGGFDPEGDRTESAGGQLVGKSLSPHISTKYTSWPYHKWLVDFDPYHYCGIDTVVAYDAAWTQIDILSKNTPKRKLVEHDNRLFKVLFRMQAHGVLIDEDERDRVLIEQGARVEERDRELQVEALTVVREKANRFKKRHLFYTDRVCTCCRGAKKKAQACWSCAGWDHAPSKKELEAYAIEGHRRISLSWKTKADWEKAFLHPCQECGGEVGQKIRTWHEEVNLGSGDQVGDILYRGLGVPPRRSGGSETVNFNQLKHLLEGRGYLAGVDLSPTRQRAKDFLVKYIALAVERSELETVERIEPDIDGRIRCVFDPWYTPTGRVAAREGLLDVGTNLQNIPYHARRFFIPDPEHFFQQPDYAQIEGRCVALMSKDRRLLEIYRSGLDSHVEVQKLLEKVAGIRLTRDQCKRLTYATIYGVEPEHLAEIFGLTVSETNLTIKAFFSVFSGLRRYQDDIANSLRTTRSVTTLTGWTRRWLGYVLEENGKNKGGLKDKIWKEGLATSPQQMGAYVLATGIIDLYRESGDWLIPQIHIHDAALIGTPLDRAVEGIQATERHLNLTMWDMPFPVESSSGPNWYVASIGDSRKKDEGYGKWTREALLGSPAA